MRVLREVSPRDCTCDDRGARLSTSAADRELRVERRDDGEGNGAIVPVARGPIFRRFVARCDANAPMFCLFGRRFRWVMCVGLGTCLDLERCRDRISADNNNARIRGLEIRTMGLELSFDCLQVVG